MDMGDVIQIAAQLFQSKLDKEGDGLDIGDIASALGTLMSDNKGNLDVGSMVSSLDAGGLMSMAASWLGDGENEALAPEQVKSIFDSGKISEFAAQLGLDENSALSGLSNTIPAVVDKSSSGGSLLDAVGGISGAIGLASKLFGR
jgi:uncharacterized protein YidB (DUF937 family)